MRALDEDLQPDIYSRLCNQASDHDYVVETFVRSPRESQQTGVDLQRRGGRTWSYDASSALRTELCLCTPRRALPLLNKISGSRFYVVKSCGRV